jgi:hypothetical protein
LNVLNAGRKQTKSTIMEKARKVNIIRISKGPQFKAKGGEFLALLSMTLLVLCIYNLFHLHIIIAAFILLAAIVSFGIALDVHGLEVDTLLHKIRDYKVLFWFRFGKWNDIRNYKTIHLKGEHLALRSTKNLGQGLETFHYYNIKLVDELTGKKIFLAEFKNYYKARTIATRIAQVTGMECKDFVKRAKIQKK